VDFIGGTATLECVSEFLKTETEEIMLAVAFWGGDALDGLGMTDWRARNVRIICNATSGACNPKALRAMMQQFGPQLKTHPKLHAKVYWTPSKMLVTSANASASGLCLEDGEVRANIEAGVAITSPDILKQVKHWLDGIYDEQETAVVDDKILKIAASRWKAARRNRISTAFGDPNTVSLTDALNQGTLLTNRDIWVVYPVLHEYSPDERRQDERLKRDWRSKPDPPAVVGGEVQFDCIESYAEGPSDLRKYYHWNSWVIDLVDPSPRFWYVAGEEGKISNRKSKTYTVPYYGAKKMPLGPALSVRMSKSDHVELRNRWKQRVGKRQAKWEPLERFTGATVEG
jgi:hypothetical protein